MARTFIVIAALLLGACASSQAGPERKASGFQGPDCMKETGSRVPRPEGECVNSPGRVHSREDIERTGEPTLGGAIDRLE